MMYLYKHVGPAIASGNLSGRGPRMATMYDTTEPASIPASAKAPDYTAGYVDGKWPTFAAMMFKYPNAVPVSITAIRNSPTSFNADVCDCETGDYTPAQAAVWATARIARGFVPTIYCSLAAWPSVVLACRAAAILAAVDWWIAAYPGCGPELYDGSVAHQWIDHGTYDESVVADGWQPGRSITPVPPAPPVPPTPEDDPMNITAFVDGTTHHVFVVDDTSKVVTHYWQDSSSANPVVWQKETLPA